MLGQSWPVTAGIPETAGHPWWRYWARATIDGFQRARPELDARQRAFTRPPGRR